MLWALPDRTLRFCEFIQSTAAFEAPKKEIIREKPFSAEDAKTCCCSYLRLTPGIYLHWERSHPNANSGLAVGHCQPCFTQLHINTYLAQSEWRLQEASSLSLSRYLSLSLSLSLSLYAGINEMTSLFAK